MKRKGTVDHSTRTRKLQSLYSSFILVNSEGRRSVDPTFYSLVDSKVSGNRPCATVPGGSGKPKEVNEGTGKFTNITDIVTSGRPTKDRETVVSHFPLSWPRRPFRTNPYSLQEFCTESLFSPSVSKEMDNVKGNLNKRGLTVMSKSVSFVTEEGPEDRPHWLPWTERYSWRGPSGMDRGPGVIRDRQEASLIMSRTEDVNLEMYTDQ